MRPPHEQGVREWASRNAYTLCFLALMFVITWTIEVILGVWS